MVICMKKTYLITGASSDIGLHFISRLEEQCAAKKEMCIVYGHYNRHVEQLLSLAKKCQYVDLQAMRCALDDYEDVERWIKQLTEEGTPTHILHLAALKFEYMRIKNLDWSKFQQEMDVQIRSFAQLMRTFLPRMAKNRYGRVVAMLTAYTLGVPPKFMCSYLTSKYALLGFVKAAAAEYSGQGITINAVSPNMMETKFLSELDPRIIEMNGQNSAMHRNVELDEVVEALFYLLSDSAAYMTGVNLNISGGDYM